MMLGMLSGLAPPRIVGYRESIGAAFKAFGQNTRTLADFYAHSNWVDSTTRGGCYSAYIKSGRGGSSRLVEQGWGPQGQAQTRLWDGYFDTVPMANIYTGTVNFLNGDISDTNRKSTHGYWEKDDPNSLAGSQVVNIYKEIEKLIQSASPRMKQIFKMDQLQMRKANVVW